MTKPRAPSPLSPVGKAAERVIETLLTDMQKDVKDHPDGKDRRYSLTDHMKVIDRAAKFEAIRARIKDDDEGSFFNKRDPDEEPETEEGANDEQDERPTDS